MAAAKTIELIVSKKVPIGSGLAHYYGTCTGGIEYPTGGAELVEDATNSRVPLPKKIDWIDLACGFKAGIAAAGGSIKCKLFVSETAGQDKPFIEFKNGTTMATAIPAGTPFVATGDA